MNNNSQYFSEIKNNILSSYPTTIRRSVCVSDIISVDHSVNKWVYERWLANNSEKQELDALHQDMANKISSLMKKPNLQITFVHLDPRIKNHPRASYS